MIGSAHWKLSYSQWLEKVEGRDDSYWHGKWQDWQTLAKAVNLFDAHTLAKIVG